jgi:uncharacterized protein
MMLADDVILPDGSGIVEKTAPLTGDTIIQLTLAGVTRLSILDQAAARKSPPVSSPPPSSPPAPAPAGPGPETSSAKALSPRIRVRIADDAMSAKIEIEPVADGGLPENLTPEIIGDVLRENGVVYGINEAKLLEISLRWNDGRNKGEFDDVAEGVAPKAGKEGPCHFVVPHLSGSRELEVIRKARGYWEAAKYLANLHRVKKDVIVAEKRYEIPPQPGVNVRGDPVSTEEKPEAVTVLETGVRLSDDGKQFVAETDGVCYGIDNAIGIAPLNFNGAFELTSDKMAARLVLRHPGPDGQMPSEHELRNLLANNLIVFGVKEDVIKDLFAQFAKGTIPADQVIVAEGLAPEHGQNGKIEFLFATETSLAPKVNPDGSVDYRNVDIVVAVPKGKELVRLKPPEPGKPGTTIFGEEIPYREGSPAVLPVGPNTGPDPENGASLIALIDGIVRYTGGCVEVTEGYVIKGDVDFSTGNIKYDKSVIINGDLKAGFSVECGGDLQVSGLIEDCTVNVGGNVLCKHGFIGQGKGVIDAKGNVNIGFILNQTVKSRKNVNVAREAINCTIYARQSITIHGNPLSIAGGTLVAREAISVYTVGNHSGVHTDLEVGLDFALLEDLKKNDDLMLDISLKHRKLTDSIKKYQHLIKLGKKLPPNEEILHNKVKIAIAKIEEQMNLLERRKKIIEVKMHELENAHIKIEHAGMPGTCFKIGDLRHFCKDEVIGPKTVRLIKGEITIA